MSEEAKELPKLSYSDIEFINAFFEHHHNRTEAYLSIHPKSSYNAARAHAARLVAKGSVKAEIERRIAEHSMSADEAMLLTADIARGDMAELMDITSVGFSMDLAKAKKLGLTKLIKKVKQKTTTFISKKPDDEDREVTELEVELYDAQAAQRDILKMHGKFTERVTLQNPDGSAFTPVTVIEIIKSKDE